MADASAPGVTIVTPSFNQGQYIEATIRSVLAQDYPAIEYIVMDGGSTDGTLEILRRYGDRLRWVSARDGGQADAINRGWRSGDGEILAWLNSDDVYLPGAVSAAVAALHQHPAALGVYGDCDYIDEHGRLIDTHPTGPFDYPALVRSLITPVPQPATFLRRDAVAAIGYLDEELSMVLDLDLWLRLGLRGPLVYLPRRLAHFREHASSKTVARQALAAPEILAIYRRLFARPDLPPAIRALEREAHSGALIMAGNSLLIAGRLAEARRHALAGLPHAAPRSRRLAWKILLVSALGHSGLSAYVWSRHAIRSTLRRVSGRARNG
jgi:glycosyltransferase involved in cell wall biosynthesis